MTWWLLHCYLLITWLRYYCHLIIYRLSSSYDFIVTWLLSSHHITSLHTNELHHHHSIIIITILVNSTTITITNTECKDEFKLIKGAYLDEGNEFDITVADAIKVLWKDPGKPRIILCFKIVTFFSRRIRTCKILFWKIYVRFFFFILYFNVVSKVIFHYSWNDKFYSFIFWHRTHSNFSRFSFILLNDRYEDCVGAKEGISNNRICAVLL